VTNTFFAKYDAGDTVPNTGKYVNTSTGQEFWLKKDFMFPPTPMPSQTYRAVVLTA
jgi:hypothetical protein